MSDSRTIDFEVNGRKFQRTVETRTMLVDLLRQDLGLTGTHIGCEHGVCGACTVLVDGHSARSCLMLAVQVGGHAVTTVEGLADPNNALSPLQQAFWEENALQCGFCTSGMLTTLTEFLAANPNPTEQDIRETISGNICRCTGYQAIVAATLLAAARIRQAKEAV